MPPTLIYLRLNGNEKENERFGGEDVFHEHRFAREKLGRMGFGALRSIFFP